jgi:hypothetical protein
MAGAGDLDGDGYDDVIFGAPQYETPESYYAGKAYVYRGGPAGLTSSPAWESTGRNEGWAYFGTSVSAAGDLNGDGKAEFAVGAPAPYSSLSIGSVYLFCLGP